MIDRIEELLDDMENDPFTGIGKPEQLKYDFAGFWSRRITEQHRVLYEVHGDVILVHRYFGHYE